MCRVLAVPHQVLATILEYDSASQRIASILLLNINCNDFIHADNAQIMPALGTN